MVVPREVPGTYIVRVWGTPVHSEKPLLKTITLEQAEGLALWKTSWKRQNKTKRGGLKENTIQLNQFHSMYDPACLQKPPQFPQGSGAPC
jgi:hypothetical protein